MSWKNPAWVIPKPNNPPPLNLAPGGGVPKLGYKGYWAWEVKSLPDEVRIINGKRIVVNRSEFTGKRVYVKPRPQWL